MEKNANKILKKHSSDRLQALVLEVTNSSLEVEVETIDAIHDYALPIQNILRSLSAKEILEVPSEIDSKSDLAKVRTALIEKKKVSLAGDGTFQVFTAPTRRELGALVAQHLNPKAHVICSNPHLLNEALRTFNKPTLSSGSPSQWGASRQLLPLMISLLWDPVSPQILLNFLCHPLCPLPYVFRNRLADVVSQEPGVGGKAWTRGDSKFSERRKRHPRSTAHMDPAKAKQAGHRFGQLSRIHEVH